MQGQCQNRGNQGTKRGRCRVGSIRAVSTLGKICTASDWGIVRWGGFAGVGLSHRSVEATGGRT